MKQVYHDKFYDKDLDPDKLLIQIYITGWAYKLIILMSGSSPHSTAS